MRVPEGWRVNARYAPGAACPRCGAMLVRLARPVTTVLPAPAAADDEEVARVEGDAFKGARRVTGYRHRATLRCPACDRMYSPAQAARRSFRDSELPADYLVRDSAPEDMWRALADSLRRGAPAAAPAAEPEQPALDLEGGAA